MAFECIVIGSHLRFDGVRQRPQHVASRLARRVPVLYVEEPFAARADVDRLRPAGDVTVLRPERTRPTAEPLDADALASVRAWVGAREALVWLYTPMMLALADACAPSPLAYDCMDDLAAFDFAPPHMRERERALLERADVVFTGGRSLYAARRTLGERVRLYASGVEFDHFARARTTAPHPLLAHLAHPICGYVGVVDERIDVAVLEALAARDTNVVLVGPVVKIDPAILPRRSNVHLTGQVPYADLPEWLAGFDVALLPFARNAATASISPTKTPEYLAAGKPVVSTRIADVVAAYGDVVTVADDAEAFADACLAASPASPERIAAGIARARTVGWDAIVERMWRDVESE